MGLTLKDINSSTVTRKVETISQAYSDEDSDKRNTVEHIATVIQYGSLYCSPSSHNYDSYVSRSQLLSRSPDDVNGSSISSNERVAVPPHLLGSAPFHRPPSPLGEELRNSCFGEHCEACLGAVSRPLSPPPSITYNSHQYYYNYCSGIPYCNCCPNERSIFNEDGNLITISSVESQGDRSNHRQRPPLLPPNNTTIAIMTNHSTTIPQLVTLLLLFSNFLIGNCSASTTLLIAGHSTNNNYKDSLARRFVQNYDECNNDNSAAFLAFSQDEETIHPTTELLINIQNVTISGNVTTVVVSQLGTDEMSLSHIEIFYSFVKTDEPLIIIEIGEQAIQTRALLDKGALCWAEARASIQSPNTAYLCNDVQPSRITSIIDINDLQSVIEPMRYNWQEEPRPFWPCLFASAAKAERKNRRKAVEIEVEDDVDEIVDKIMEDYNAEEKQEKKTDTKEHVGKSADNKLSCKYRKSCYETGDLPDIDQEYHFWFTSSDSDDKDEDVKDAENIDDVDFNEEEDDITDAKFKCKYRYSCYKERSIPMSIKEQKQNDGEETEAKPVKKRTLKEIADRTIKRVKEAEEKAASRPISTAMKAEKRINEVEEKLNEKLKCKYRKSCYESGELPKIAETTTWSIPYLDSFQTAETPEEDKKEFEDMEELEQKVHCKYRKSCYSTGVIPTIENFIQINSFEDLASLPEAVETRKLTVQEKCKYRKSCYETGVLPDLQPMEAVVQKEVSGVLPTSVGDLKFLCKYRKSCYAEVAESATADTVKNIRKRRMVEKEVRKQKARMAKIRHRMRLSDMKGFRQTSTEKKVEKEQEIKESVAKKSGKKIVAEKVVAETEEEPVETVATKIDVSKKSQKKRRHTPPPPQEQPVEVAETAEEKEKELEVPEPVVEEKPKLKKNKKVKKAPEPEPEPIETPEPEPQPVKEEEEKEDDLPPPPPTPAPKLKTKKSKKAERKQEQESVVEDNKHENIKEEPSTESGADKEHLERQQQRDFCKYRKSCYESGEKPTIIQTLDTLFTSFNSHVDDHYKKVSDKPKSDADQKLDCKYRKSCYETGELPDLTVANIDRDGDKPSFKEISSGMSKKLLCKYRKSCYEAMGIEDDNHHHHEKVHEEEVKKPVMEKVKEAKVVVEKDDSTEKSDDDDDEEDDKDKKVVHARSDAESGSSLSVDQKLDCKYRRSCYGNVKPRTKNQDHSGSMARPVQVDGMPLRTKCNKYYLSCREQLGLGPKEKAPIGPNGRRLCRKKKE